MTGRTKLRPVTRASPCPLCQGHDGCSSGEDGLLLCRRREGPQPGFVHLGRAKGDEQFCLYRRQDDPVLQEREQWESGRHHTRNGTPSGNGAPAGERIADRARRLAANLTPAGRAELAAELGLPESALALLPGIGFSATGFHRDYAEEPCYVFPERDAAGDVTGLLVRYPDRRKMAMAGYGRGLTVPTGWREREGPILLPEGPSCTLALTSMGLAAVGRPSNLGGVDHLAALLGDLPADRPLVVLGEHDANDRGLWPGRDGAVRTAAALAERLGRAVAWVLPPAGSKDARAWCLARKLDPACADAWSVAGQEFLNAVLPRCQRVEPAGEVAGFRWEPIDFATFMATEYRPKWIVKLVLVRGQPGVIGGPRKSMKTSLLVDLAVSLASGTPFLGCFQVPEALRVVLLSGESGEYTLQETAARVCAPRGIHYEEIKDRLPLQFRLPQLANPDDLGHLRDGLKAAGTQVMILDPLYLSLLSGGGPNGPRAENLYETGPLLLRITQACLSIGCTPLLIHHTKKNTAAILDPLDLDDLAFSGVAEFARQWLLINRRKPFVPGSGSHRLWVNVGGSVGHGGLWSVDIEEGTTDENFQGRFWDVKLSTATEARQVEKKDREEEKRQKQAEQDRADDAAVMTALDRLDPKQKGASYNQVQEAAALSDSRMTRAVLRLKEAKTVKEKPVVVKIGNRAKRPVKGLARCPDP